MGIRRKVSQTYVTDRGIEMEVGNTTPSHLINAIAHHTKQIETLRKACEGKPIGFDAGFLGKRISALVDTVDILTAELAKRDPDFDHWQETEGSLRNYSSRDRHDHNWREDE